MSIVLSTVVVVIHNQWKSLKSLKLCVETQKHHDFIALVMIAAAAEPPLASMFKMEKIQDDLAMKKNVQKF